MTTDFILSIILTSMGFIGYHFSMNSEELYKKLYPSTSPSNTAKWVTYQRLCGMFFLGLLPMICVLFFFQLSFAELGINGENLGKTALYTLGLCGLLVFMNSQIAGKPDNLTFYPQIRSFPWTPKTFFLNSWGWIGYLVAYEFLFRGVLFFGTLHYIGLTAAVALNACIYALVHIPKGIKETIGAIPLGIVLCLISYDTNNIWTALLVHIALALSNDYFAHKAQVKLLQQGK